MIFSNKIALFIDGANLYATAKTLGFDIDYKPPANAIRPTDKQPVIASANPI